ncbi:MAG: thiamine pyrophosphate-dependent dehydrogenase E1 component subunit alpha, partial [Candidatus Omnitrophica bacterium]|nr:thiamine pyrophosphate-dependent dehydrogenase E1 component subunit alpha [Candidatus Omnitrophota bacterium]
MDFKKIYYDLQKIRKVELKIEELYPKDEMKTPVHLSLGQEAVAVGVCANLRKEDNIFSNHRSHAHYLAKGGDLKAMIAELYCKETGCAKGRGGSMHLIDTSVGHLGSSAIVGGAISHAVGAALAYKLQKKDLVAVTFFGDAAVEQGVLYESFNFAKLKNLPVVFICENNYYSVCSHLSARQPDDKLYMRSKGFGVPSMVCDGMDFLKVFNAAKKAIDHARGGKGPYFLEFKVQRWRAHSGGGDPIAEQYRKKADLDKRNIKDPIKDFEEYLLKKKIVEQSDMEIIKNDIDSEIGEAFDFAQKSPLPDNKDL